MKLYELPVQIFMICFLSSFDCSGSSNSVESHCNKNDSESSCDENIEITSKCIQLTKGDIGPQDPSWFIIIPRGRLGNHIVGYSIIQALAATLGIRPLLAQETDDYMRKYFNIAHSISIYEDTFCNIEEIERFQMTYFEGSIDEIAQNKKYHK